MKQMTKTAKRLAAELGTRNPFTVAENYGILVLYQDLPDCTKGICYEVQGKKIIIINRSLSKSESVYVCAHEVGHALLHPNINLSFLKNDTYFEPKKFEREADIFAAELLIDDSILNAPEHEHMNLSQLANLLNLPEKLLKLKLNSCN